MDFSSTCVFSVAFRVSHLQLSLQRASLRWFLSMEVLFGAFPRSLGCPSSEILKLGRRGGSSRGSLCARQIIRALELPLVPDLSCINFHHG